MSDPIVSIHPLGFVWETNDPFLFCVHHDDAYPAGTERMSEAELAALVTRDSMIGVARLAPPKR